MANRVALMSIGVSLTVLLALAGWLQPEQRGMGTHQQLGLPPCTMFALLGVRCPSCGMTTSWAYLVRGQIEHALAANVGGTVLGLLAAVVVPWSLTSACWGRWLGVCPSEKAVLSAGAAILAIVMIDWMQRLW